MTTSQIIRLAEWLFLPPGIIVLFMIASLTLLLKGRKTANLRAATFILLVATVLAYTTTIRVTASWLTFLLEEPGRYPALTEENLQHTQAEAIVILGYGRYAGAPEYNHTDTLSTGGLARVRYGAYLHRKTGLPILAVGGRVQVTDLSEGDIMKKVLEEEFQVPVRWIETESTNTFENAKNATEILSKAGVTRILMVTHLSDISRALEAFRQTGSLQVTPAPTLFGGGVAGSSPLDWIPNPYAAKTAAMALHEHLGKIWYKIRYYQRAGSS